MLAVSKIYQSVNSIPFPEFQKERIYMVPFVKGDGLPSQYSRWQPTVDSMLKDVPDHKVGYLMVDEVETAAGSASRRPGIHVDGYWNPDAVLRRPGHPDRLGAHGGGRHSGVLGHTSHLRRDGVLPEAIFLASNVSGCVAYEGAYLVPKQFNMGDCSSVDTSRMKPVALQSHTAYIGHSMFLLHESAPVAQDSKRAVVRINVPGWLPVQ